MTLFRSTTNVVSHLFGPLLCIGISLSFWSVLWNTDFSPTPGFLMRLVIYLFPPAGVVIGFWFIEEALRLPNRLTLDDHDILTLHGPKGKAQRIPVDEIQAVEVHAETRVLIIKGLFNAEIGTDGFTGNRHLLTELQRRNPTLRVFEH